MHPICIKWTQLVLSNFKTIWSEGSSAFTDTVLNIRIKLNFWTDLSPRSNLSILLPIPSRNSYFYQNSFLYVKHTNFKLFPLNVFNICRIRDVIINEYIILSSAPTFSYSRLDTNTLLNQVAVGLLSNNIVPQQFT